MYCFQNPNVAHLKNTLYNSLAVSKVPPYFVSGVEKKTIVWLKKDVM